ncbi:MAG: PKD domain-containing protein [Bacteroidota bacterium]
MKKAALFAFSGCLLLALGAFFIPCSSSCDASESLVPKDREAFATRINAHQAVVARMAMVMKWRDDRKTSGRPKYSNPEMFAIYDRMKRINPVTGEFPQNGLSDAMKYIEQEWGSMEAQRTGYALQWETRGPTNVGGRTRAVMWDPNDNTNRAAFAGGVGGGLWYNTDVTVSSTAWSQVSPTYANVAVTCITHDPSNPQVMYYGTGEGWGNIDQQRGAGLWKSVDGGMTWNHMLNTDIPDFWFNQDLIVDANGVLYVASKAGLYRSTDGGTTLTKVLGQGVSNAPNWITDLEIAGNGDLYAGIHSGGVYKSENTLGTNQGTQGNWTRLNISFPGGYDRVEVAVGKNNSNILYAVCEVNQGASSVFKSTNAGTSWSLTSNQPGGLFQSNDQAWYDLCLEVDPFDANRVYTGAIDVHRSTNGGASWGRIAIAYGGGSGNYMHPDQHAIVPNPLVQNRLLIGNDGGVYYSANGGNSRPNPRNNNYNVTQFYSLAISTQANSPRLIGGTQDNGSIMVNQMGLVPGIDLTGGDGSYCAIYPGQEDTMFTTSQWETLYRSNNGGNNFTFIGNAQLSQNNTLFINPIEIDPFNPNVLYQASTALWRHGTATSGGSNGWQQVTVPIGQITAISPTVIPANSVYFAANGTLYRLDAAFFAGPSSVPNTINPTGLNGGYINHIWVDPNDGDHILVPFSSYGLNQRVVEINDADQGANATVKDLTGNLPDLPCHWIAQEPNNPNGLLVGTDLGVFRCGDYTVPESSIYWQPANVGLGWPRVTMIKTRYADSTVHLSTHGRGFFSTSSYSQAPVAAFAATNTFACGGFVQFIDSSANVPSSWTWDFGDGNSSTLQSPNHQYATSGTYTVSLTVSNVNGTNTTTQSVNVVVAPQPVAQAGPDVTSCPGDTLQFTASGGSAYSWFPTAGLSDPNISNPTHVVAGNRTYVVTVTDSNGCVDTDTLVVSQLTVPNTWAGPDQTITAPNDSVQLQGSGADLYAWSPATGLSCTNCPNPKAYPAVTTTYTLVGTDTNGCSRSDVVDVEVAIVSVEDPLGNSVAALRPVSPNPVTDRARFSYTLTSAMEVGLDLVDLRGKVVAQFYEGPVTAGEHNLNWERNGTVASGVYLLRLRAGEQFFIQRMIVAD